MSRALVANALAATAAVFAALLLRGTPWTTGGGVLTLAVIAFLSRRFNCSRWATVAAPYLAVAAVIGIVAQVVGVALHGSLGRAGGFLPHPNIASATAVALWVLLLVGIGTRTATSAAWRLVAVGGGVGTAFLLLAAGTRSVVLGLVLGLVLVAAIQWLGNRPAKRWTLNAVTIVGVLIVLGGIATATVWLRADVDEVFGSFERGPIFMTALDIAALSPWVGSGDGAWARLAPLVEPSLPLGMAPHSHSVALTLMMEGGALGFTAITLLILVWFSSMIRGFSKHNSLSAGALIIGAVALGSQGLVDTVFMYFPSVYMVFGAAVWLHQGQAARNNWWMTPA